MENKFLEAEKIPKAHPNYNLGISHESWFDRIFNSGFPPLKAIAFTIAIHVTMCFLAWCAFAMVVAISGKGFC